MEVKVRIEGKFYWKTEWQQFVFDGRVFLPADNKGYIPLVLLNEKVTFFGEKLGQSWGNLEGEERYKCLFISADTFCELEEKLKSRVQEEIAVLKQVKEENLKKMNQTKEVIMEFIV